MSVRRVLAECVVLSLQDTCVFYPCCKRCFSRTHVEQQDTTRCRCSKCGYSCLRDQDDHRYRLSLRVARDTRTFGVTVFGTCLNQFFGVHASGLQSILLIMCRCGFLLTQNEMDLVRLEHYCWVWKQLVENFEGPVAASARSTLLVKAVEDCFIGRHFIFGIKVNETGSGHWIGGPVENGSRSNDTVQFIASQMILPKATGLTGCTVVSYYRILLQKATEYELGSTDIGKSSGAPATPRLLILNHSPPSSFNNATLSASGLLSQSLQRSQYQDCTLTPTPPWQQSLGLVTSSAEQEEGCSPQDSGDENSRHTDNNKTPRHAQGSLKPEVTEETVRSPLLSLECNSYNSLSFAKSPYSPVDTAAGNTPILDTWFSPSPPGHSSSGVKGFSTRHLTKTFSSSTVNSTLAWEDLPFSESLTEFVCEENKDVDIVGETEPHLNVQNRKEMARNNLEITSQDKNLSIESTSVSQSDTQITDSHSQITLDANNTSAPNEDERQRLSEQAGNTCTHECSQEDEKASSPSFENEEEEAYNCSADLFSSSLVIDVNTNTLNMHAETAGTTAEACPPLSKPDEPHPRSEKSNVPHSAPNIHKLKRNKCKNRGSLIPPCAQDVDFIPSSQSTPIVKEAVSRSPASSYRTLTLGEFTSQPDSRDSCAFSGNLTELDSKKPAKIPSSFGELHHVTANQPSRCGRETTKDDSVWCTTSSRRSHRYTPRRRLCKPDKHKKCLLAPQRLRIQRVALNPGSTGRINHKCDCDVTVCDYEDSGVIVPPTPAAKTRQSVELRRRRQTDGGSSNPGYTWEGKQGDGVIRKRTLLDQTLTSSQRGPAQTGSGDSETVEEGSLESNDLLYDENKACDWSRDLFSDSV